MSRTVFVVAGEVSGDTHGAELMRALLEEEGGFEFRGLGGPEMRAVGGEMITDWVEEAAVVGFYEVLKRYGWFRARFDRLVAEIERGQPELLLLIDYPGFNLRLAREVKKRCAGTKIVHYVAPQVWAWNQRRIPEIVKSHDLMICLFPFEVPIFEEAGLRSRCVGHPLVDELEVKRISDGRREALVGLFPGSREREIRKLFPQMLEAAGVVLREFPEVVFEAAAASEKSAVLMEDLVRASRLDGEAVRISVGASQELMQRATCGVVASGTATLEAAYYGLPYCLVYQVAWGTYQAARHLVKLPHIGLINILAGREVVPELIQDEVNPYEISTWLRRALRDEDGRSSLSRELVEVASALGETGVHRRAAREIIELFSKNAADQT